MARLHADITFGLAGQTVETRVLQGRPTSATFRALLDSTADTGTAEFTGNATVDTVNTTVSGASGPSQADPQKLSLTSTAAIVTNRKYLVSEGSKSEWIQPVEIVTGSYIRCRHPLKNDYTAAATFVSTTITAAIDATWVALESKLSDPSDPNPTYRVLWTITLASGVILDYSYFDLVCVPSAFEVDLDDLDARAPGLADTCPVQFKVEQGRPLIDSAWRAVKAKLAAHKLDTDAFHNDEILDELVILKALHIVAGGGWRPAGYDSVAQYVIDKERDFETLFQQHISVTLKSNLGTSSGGSTPARPLSFWSK